ncbi:MAG: DNA topoisomerase 3 [Muribaculaceae bacterium]|nr:DNA topoisomerase 3 [Muribaculaceae bacterium]
MILCITEKPSVGADIARILGANVRRDGYFEGNGYWVTWTFGHLCTLKDPADYSPYWKKWSMSYLPMIPPRFGIKLIADKGIEHQFSVIESLIKQATELVNCGDAGQEGELIQRWVMQKAGCNIPVKRLWISSLTDESIIKGFENLKPQDDYQSLYEAGLCRSIGDWILGINATRLYTLKYRKPGRHDAGPLSVGRVQTPTLALIVKRQQEIDNFVPKDTWELKTLYRDTLFSSELDPFPTPEKAEPLIAELAALPFTVTSVTRKKVAEAPPKLFDLTSLQVEAVKKFSMGAEDCLRTIQSLYEKKLTTYPRVDTTYLNEDIYAKCPATLLALTDYARLVEPLKGKSLRKSKKVFDNSKVTDHHAIIPTGVPLPANLTDRERKIYDLVARRFIAVFYPDCISMQTTVKAKVGKYDFKTSGKVPQEPGWKAVYAKEQEATPANAASATPTPAPTDAPDTDERQSGNGRRLPDFVKGESGPHVPQLKKRTSQPPKLYTEGTLLKAMETAGSQVDDDDLREALKANGIGRPSTRAAIIELLIKRGYITNTKTVLRPTQAGIDLIGIIKDDLLKSVELTGIWENRLRRIERKEYSPAEFIGQLKEMIRQITLNVMRENSGIYI